MSMRTEAIYLDRFTKCLLTDQGALYLRGREDLKKFDLVIVGHITIDRIERGERQWFEMGGPPAYAMVALALGIERAGIVSRIGLDFPNEYYEIIRNSGLNLEGLIQNHTTTQFVNRYTEGGDRTQEAKHIASPIMTKDIPASYWDTTWMHLSPVLQEVDSSIILKAKQGGVRVSIDAQGFIRRRISKQDPRITACQWDTFPEVAPSIDVLKADIDEICHLTQQPTVEEAVKAAYKAGCNLILITRGQMGSYLYYENKLSEIPPIPSHKIADYTGSGDVFAISFLTEFQRTERPLWSAFFASSSASFNIETAGPTNFPSHEEVTQRLRVFLTKSNNQRFMDLLLDETGPMDCLL